MGSRMCSAKQNMDNKQCGKQSVKQGDRGRSDGSRSEERGTNLATEGEDVLALPKEERISESEVEELSGGLEDVGGSEDPVNGGENGDLKNGGDCKDPKNGGDNRVLKNEGDSKDPMNEGESRDLRNGGDSKDPKNEGESRDLKNEGDSKNPTNDGKSRDLKNVGDSQHPKNEGNTKDIENDGYSTDLKNKGDNANPKNGGDSKGIKNEDEPNKEQIGILDVNEEHQEDLKNEQHSLDRKDVRHADLKSEGHIMSSWNEESEYREDSDSEEHQDNEECGTGEHKTGLENEVHNADVMSEENEEQAAGPKHEECSPDPKSKGHDRVPENEEHVINLEQSTDPDHEDPCLEPGNEEHNTVLENEEGISDLGNEKECIHLKNESHSACPMNEELKTDSKNEEPAADSNEDKADPKNEDTVPKNEIHSKDVKSGDHSKDSNVQYNTDPENEERSADQKNEEYNIRTIKEEHQTYAINEEQKSDLKDEERETHAMDGGHKTDTKNEECKTGLKNKECETDLKKEECETGLKNEECETDLKKEECETGLKNEECETDLKKEECETGLKNEECETDLKKEECETLPKNEECETDTKNEECETDLEKEECETDLKKEECETDLKNEECETDLKKEECETGLKNEECETDLKKDECETGLKIDECETDTKKEESETDHPKNEKCETDLKNVECETGLKNEERETDLKVKECETDLKNQESETDWKNEKCEADLKNEECKTDPENKECETDPIYEECETDPKNEECEADMKIEEHKTDLEINHKIDPKNDHETDVKNEENETEPRTEKHEANPKNNEHKIMNHKERETDLENEAGETGMKNEKKTDLKNEEQKADLNKECETDLENEEQEMHSKDEKDSKNECEADPKNDKWETDPKNDKWETDPKNSCEADPKNEECGSDSKNEGCEADPKNEECETGQKNEECETDLKNEECETDPKNKECETDTKNEECEADLNEECETDSRNEECETDPKNGEFETDLKNEECGTELKNELCETGLKNEECETDPICEECEIDTRNEERGTDPKNEECEAALKNECETDPKNEECETDPKNGECETEPIYEECETDSRNDECVTDPKNEECEAHLKNEECESDPKNGECETEPIYEECETDSRNEECETDPKNEECEADLKNEECETDTENEEHKHEERQERNEDHEEYEEEENSHVDRTELASIEGKMSGKSKCVLTENGVLELYSQNLQHSINVQVIFVATNDMMSYLRLSDGKHVSPVVLLVKKDGKPGFGVGAVLTIHDVAMHIAPGKSDKNEKDSNLVEVGFNQVIIKKYNILQSQSSVGKILGSLDQSATYRDAIRHVQEPLRLNDCKFEAYIKFDAKTCKQLMAEGEKAREKGNYYFNKKDFNQAIIHYDIAKKKDPYDHRVWSNCSQALFKVGQYAYAESDALIAIKLNPFHMKAYYRAGQAASKLSRKSIAEVYARSGIFACGSSSELLQLLEETLNSSKKANIEIAAASLSSTSISVTSKLEQEYAKLGSNTPYTYKVTKGTQANIVEVTIHDKCENQKGTGKKSKQEKGSKENLVHIAGLAQLEERLMNEVHEMWDKGEERENNKQKGNNHEKEKKVEEKRRTKVEEIGRLEEKSFTNEYFLECLHRARRAYEERNFMKAVILFQQCLDVYSLENVRRCSAAEPHYEQTLQFLVAATAIKGEPDQPLEAIKIMESLLKHSSLFRNSPAVYYFLAFGYSKKFMYQCRNKTDIADAFTIISCKQSYQLAQQYTKKCGEAIREQKTAPAIKWPGSNDPIPETVVSYMKVLHLDFTKEMENLMPKHKPPKISSQESDNKSRTSNITAAEDSVSTNNKKSRTSNITAAEDSVSTNNKNKTSTARSTPVSRCRFKDCLSTQGHDSATEEIYVTDPEFKGYLEVTCEENCIISYHPCCWKAHKEYQEDRVGKLSDKDFLGTDCITPDCTGKISCIHIYDETGNLKIELSNKKDKKNAQNSVKQKKKKDKKKEKAQANKNADKKKTKHESVSEDTVSTEKTQAKADNEAEKTKAVNNNETNSDKKKTPASVPNLPIDPESLESSQVIVLKPTTEREEPTETKNSKKNKKKKNKKNKAIQPDLLGDPLECEQSNQNEYVARLKLLKQQREALENDNVPLLKVPLAIPTRETPSEQVLELLDPDNPFYLPEHLRDNPKALESVLQSKMSAGSSVSSQVSGICPESITVLLDFMYDWLKSEGPMSITDARIRQYVEENFPPEANTHVVQCGGIKQFLLQSINFAMIDEVICVRDHVVRAQEMIRKSVLERMNTSRYLISDGRRAKKFTHLLDDTKSSCSSSSSASHVAGSGVSYASTGLSGTTTSSVKLVNGEMNNNSKDSRKNVPSSFTSGLDEFDTSDMPAVRPKLNPTAPEFEPRSNDEEEEDFNNQVCSEDEEENIKTSNKCLRTSKPSECESNQDPGIATQDGDELFQSDDDEEYMDDEEEEQYTESLENQLKQKQEQIQTLNDRLYQMKTQMGLEITKLKQQVQDIKEEKRTIQTEKESLSAQRESEAKKLRSELSRLQEEMKATQTRTQSLENKCERSNDRANEFEAKLMEEQEVTAQLREEIRNLQESLTSSSRRAHEAEVKYLCTKKDLVEAHLTRTITRLTEEASLMRLLHQTASDETKPDRATLSRSIVAWDDSIKSLRDRKRIFLEEAVRVLGMVNQGRPLNALPLGDLDVPAIPDMSVAPLLMAQQKMGSKPMPKLPIGEQAVNRPGNSSSSSPQPVPGPPGTKALLPTPIGPPLHMGATPTPLDTRPLYLHNGVNPLAFTGGAIPKRATPAQPSTTPELPGTQKWPDSHQLFVGQLPWEFNEGDIKPITVGNHTLNVQAKESKKPTKPPSLAVGSLASTAGEPATVGSHSAYGLSDISLNANAEASKTAVGPLPSPILHPPSTTTVTKPKFQNLTSNNSVGAIGTPPPKLVRPLPRQPPNAVKGAIPNPASKDDSVTSTASYKRLIEICKQRVGKEYSSPEVCSALREVRIQNNKSLSGLNVDMIVDRVKAHLKSRRPGSGQATLAPWASLTQCPKSGNGGPDWQGPGGDEGSAPEEQCSICLEALNACPTVPLQCQHVFHEKCIKDWLKRQSNCPNCRTFALMTDEYPSLTHS